MKKYLALLLAVLMLAAVFAGVLNILHVIHSFPVRADLIIIHFFALFRFSAKL